MWLVKSLRNLQNISMTKQNDLGRVNGFIEEMMDGQKVVKVFNHEERAKEDFPKT